MEKGKAIAKPLEERDMGELTLLALGGDKAACKVLYARSEETGVVDSLVESLTGSAHRVRKLTHSNPLLNEAYRRKMNQMRDDLGVKTGTELEKLLIERIVLCWYHLNDMETRYASQMKDELGMEKAVYLQKSLDRAEARYQAAIKSLAVVRRLQIPAVQVNIGEKQVNIVQGRISEPNAPPAMLED